MTKLKKVT